MSAEPTSETNVARRTPRPWVVWVMAVLAVAAIPLALLIPVPERFRPRVDPKPAVDDRTGDIVPDAYRIPLPEFRLNERSGKSVGRDDLAGKVWIASFVFTRCTMGCPSVTATMSRLQNDFKIADRDDLRLVTFTVDPERDGTADLKEYARKFHADDTKWLFLTGEEKVVRPLLKEGFKIAADRREKPRPGDEFDHSTKLAAIDKKGRLCAYFDGMAGEHDPSGQQLERSLNRLRALVDQLVTE